MGGPDQGALVLVLLNWKVETGKVCMGRNISGNTRRGPCPHLVSYGLSYAFEHFRAARILRHGHISFIVTERQCTI
ncbi:hypothetical protein LIPSTDRAFT_204700 [Lipomyces starkeyi NRRL Y-11557]|uniref:Uncharacterized protein n=1 Tax=Lipomyces starkeyi NRRL Y-11557 TaxID=675824 RepID=A0A1E3PU98_LIPST|nr:hypothetical protein LIPSTDRAFT_204700 [Lipomyces starkeyi NRRL Y-11557]